ncbi:MAG: cysteine desulfurase family protein [Selenomonas sp.]|uniref:cysteine desulfurase family protein n=1 Tax=Selenomonas sp. TaxID=2053611 RepID=UPI0025CED595|nr:cysteine desulfurase family protein [Selenomonas sp.]MCI6086968.1 cysteine desulfurase [Selenomonas sp.]MDY6349347.1 cysteine desulfurase family protein [Selenomonas sp.]
MKQLIYADHAATTKLDTDAWEAMRPYLQEEYGNISEPYQFSRKAKKAARWAREQIAEAIGAAPEEIFFTSGGTESDNWAIKGMLAPGRRDEILTSKIEHHAILRSCRSIGRFGYIARVLPVTEKGVVRAETLQSALSVRTRLVSIMMANNEIGTIEPIAELARIAHEQGAFFHTDAVQAVGHLPIDVDQLGVDLLSASGHKFNGPKGSGFLYVRKDTPIFPWMDGGAQESGMRAGTENVAAMVGMAVALQKNIARMEETSSWLMQLEHIFIQKMMASGLDFLRNGAENHVPGNISISIRYADGEMLLHRLDLKGICVSTGSACNSGSTKISHVLRAIGVPEEYAKGTIRITLGKENSEEDVRKIVEDLSDICNKS